MEPPSPPKGYLFCSFLSYGGFSQVWKGKNEENGTEVAIKVIHKNSMCNNDTCKRISEEKIIHSSLKNDYIASFIEFIEDISFSYFIIEFVERGTLLSRLKKDNFLTEIEIFHYFEQICLAVYYLHEVAHVIHHDLKLQNILVDANNNVKVIDFGFSQRFSLDNNSFYSTCGSPKYCAPEMFSNTAHNQSVDIWSLGIILYRMVTGVFPFDHPKISKLSQIIQTCEPDYSSIQNSTISDLVQRLLCKDQTKRINILGIFNHEWFKMHSTKSRHIMSGSTSFCIDPNRTRPKLISRAKSSSSILTLLENGSLTNQLCESGRFKKISQTPQKSRNIEKSVKFSFQGGFIENHF